MTAARIADQIPAAVRAAAEAGDALCLFVPWDAGRTSANQTRGRHWSKLHSEQQEAELAALWAWREAGDPVLNAPLVVDTLLFRGALLDEDNARSGCKQVSDFLFKGRLVPDDSARWVQWGTLTQLPGREYARHPWTVFLVRPRPVEAGETP